MSRRGGIITQQDSQLHPSAAISFQRSPDPVFARRIYRFRRFAASSSLFSLLNVLPASLIRHFLSARVLSLSGKVSAHCPQPEEDATTPYTPTIRPSGVGLGHHVQERRYHGILQTGS